MFFLWSLYRGDRDRARTGYCRANRSICTHRI